MAINTQTLQTRALTALVFVFIMFAGLFINVWCFTILFMIIMFGCLYEFSKIVKKINPQRYILFLPIAFIYIILPLLLLIDLGINGNYYTHKIIGSNRASGFSALLPCTIIFSLWVNDTMAYLVGSMIGKTPFSKISPKKTWEGTIGGAVLCIVSMGLLGHYIPGGKIISWQHYVCMAAICTLFGTLGDLLESKLKRMANTKDSGTFMPGHGGFLDRFDSLLGAAAFAWIYINLFF